MRTEEEIRRRAAAWRAVAKDPLDPLHREADRIASELEWALERWPRTNAYGEYWPRPRRTI